MNVGDRILTKFGWGMIKRIVEGRGYSVLLDRHKEHGYTATTAIYYKDIMENQNDQ